MTRTEDRCGCCIWCPDDAAAKGVVPPTGIGGGQLCGCHRFRELVREAQRKLDETPLLTVSQLAGELRDEADWSPERARVSPETQAELDARYTCGRCGKTWLRDPRPGRRACAVLHKPGDCCHYGEAEVLAGEPESYLPDGHGVPAVPWPLKLAYDGLDTVLEFLASLGWRPDWYKEEWER